ncbi:uncharacterized protein F5891DRAFT_987291 [Suillus fuscotomentosus]|uniref:Uncharacterized protein n=1 Tax=Suillus fuscotomentosus TaxID=1912939 RepID=A0AAD4DQK3_9AGAM|nr:uncharacterized protein F5891DRAFT_987291 [Suillus fuscotomentosus]KAG1889706.1 hypothetical protein F5891DRAFT_987291 [Suillus fuscotomentosus]
MSNADESQCASNLDGTLKDASEITFYESESDEIPINKNSVTLKIPAKSAPSQLDIHSALTKSGALPAARVAGSRVQKPAWKLTTHENAASSSSATNHKCKHQLLDPNDYELAPVKHKTSRMHIDSEDESQDPPTSVLEQDADGHNDAQLEDEDDNTLKSYAEIQDERCTETQVCLLVKICLIHSRLFHAQVCVFIQNIAKGRKMSDSTTQDRNWCEVCNNQIQRARHVTKQDCWFMGGVSTLPKHIAHLCVSNWDTHGLIYQAKCKAAGIAMNHMALLKGALIDDVTEPSTTQSKLDGFAHPASR